VDTNRHDRRRHCIGAAPARHLGLGLLDTRRPRQVHLSSPLPWFAVPPGQLENRVSASHELKAGLPATQETAGTVDPAARKQGFSEARAESRTTPER